jgi:hypothetical protein
VGHIAGLDEEDKYPAGGEFTRVVGLPIKDKVLLSTITRG